MENTAPRLPASRGLLLALALLALTGLAAAQGVYQTGALPGDLPLSRLPENKDLREAVMDSLLMAPTNAALAFRSRDAVNAWGAWNISVRRERDALYAVFAPLRGTVRHDYAQGSWILKRSLADGSPLQVKIFLRSDRNTFIRVYPFGDRCLMDVVAYGGVLYHKVILPLPFDALLNSPFSRIMDLSSAVVDWDLFSPDPALYSGLRDLIAGIRLRLPGLRFADDGATDADGAPVRIADLSPQPEPAGLNCSGFAKWIVDGLAKPVSGRWLAVAPLKERMLDYRGSSFTEKFEESMDPFFGLDWARALALRLWGIMYPSRTEPSPLAYDVNESPFSLIVRAADALNGDSLYEPFSANFDDAGIETRGLSGMLYLLAVREPGRWYLAEFSARSRVEPRLRRYFHLAALFPYVDSDGVFRVAVFESAAETSLQRILADPDYEFVKLVRMPSSPRFDPPVLPSPATDAGQAGTP